MYIIGMSNTLSFSIGNAKLSKAIGTFSLPAGHTCPFAKNCLSTVDRNTGKLMDGKHCQFRCFAASAEARLTNVRESRWNNYELLLKNETIQGMGQLIQDSLPAGIYIIRIHASGDFFSEKYFLAWLNVAINNPHIIFYAYTKATPFMVKYKKQIPHNFRITASKGGSCDHLIEKHKLRYAEVVLSVKEAEDKKLELDFDDSHAYGGNKSFALLIHGTQPEGTLASKAWQLIKKTIGGYSENNNHNIIHERKLIVHVNIKNNKTYIPIQTGKPVFTPYNRKFLIKS